MLLAIAQGQLLINHRGRRSQPGEGTLWQMRQRKVSKVSDGVLWSGVLASCSPM